MRLQLLALTLGVVELLLQRVAFLAKALRIPELSSDAAVKFEIWDTAGQERYASLAPLYYRGAGAAVVVYDITSTASFEKVEA